MSRTYVSPGEVITYTNSTGSDIVSGELVAVGNVIGVALGDIANGATGEVAIEGIHNVLKKSGADCVFGTTLVLDVSQNPNSFDDGAFTPASGDISGGALCVEAAGTGVLTVKVKLLPGSGSVT